MWANPTGDLPFDPNANTSQIILRIRDAWQTLDLQSLRRVHHWMQFVIGMHRLQQDAPPRVLLQVANVVHTRMATAGKTPGATYPMFLNIGAQSGSQVEAQSESTEFDAHKSAPEPAIDADAESKRDARSMSNI